MHSPSYFPRKFLQRTPYTAERFEADCVSATARVEASAVESGIGGPKPMGPIHDPPLQPRDEAVFLLNVLAEVEHALLVQYLFAAYSVRVDPTIPRAQHFQDVLLQIAREEMGHLATVQNLLHVLGGPLNLHREQSPFASALYPFRFKLQPLTLGSLAKYVVAESPEPPPPDLPEEDKMLLCETIEPQAKADNGGIPVQHVGAFFQRLLELFRDSEHGLQDADFRADTANLQARFEDWGYAPESSMPMAEPLVVAAIDGETPNELRRQAIRALEQVAEQGEGHDPGPVGTESHFERFFTLYKDLNSATSGGKTSVTWPIPINPNTSSAPEHHPKMDKMVDMVLESHAAAGRITDPRARAWAQLFNVRYRMLLAFLSHFLRLNGRLFRTENDVLGDRTERGLLLIWTFYEMRRLRKIALKLVQLPKDDIGEMHAGPPFELPYTLNLPESETARWRTHLDVSRAAATLAAELQREHEDPDDDFLTDLVRLDEADQRVMAALAQGDAVPADALPADFQKIATILEEAVRGFGIGSHGNFWDRIDRDDFLSGAPGFPNIRPRPAGGFDADRSPLVERLEGTAQRQMPRFRPPIPPERLRFLREWIENDCPHNGELGMERERTPREESVSPPTPPTGDPLSFGDDIQGLFRDQPDRSVMLVFGLDLHSYQDVSNRADDILARLKDGSMPCDMPWSPERIAKFQQWIEDGKRP